MDQALVDRLVNQGEDLTLGQVVESVRYCKMNCGLFGDPPGWSELFGNLTSAVDKLYPDQVSWRVPYCLMKGDHAKEIINKDIKEKYVRILLFSKGYR